MSRTHVDLAPRSSRAMPVLLSEVGGVIVAGALGARNKLDKKGRIVPLHPRPWTSYRGARRALARPFFQKACKRRIDPEANLAFLLEAATLKAALSIAAVQDQARWEFIQQIEEEELTRMKLTRSLT